MKAGIRSWYALATLFGTGFISVSSAVAQDISADEIASFRAEIIDHYVNPCAIAVVRNNVEAKNLPEEVSDEDIALIVRITTRGGLELMMDSLVPRVSTMGSGERHQFYAESLNRCIITNIGATEVIDTLQKAQAESASIP